MQINWIVIFVFAAVVIAVVIFTIRRNLKDKKTLETFLDHDFESRDDDADRKDEG